jgi:acyl-CoA synthetase (NDP forming)
MDEFKSIAIIGASKDRSKYGNKAVRAYVAEGKSVYPVNPNESEIEGIPAYKSVLDIPGEVDVASLYLPPGIGITVLEEIARKGIKRLLINPGAESEELVAKATSLGLDWSIACSILAIGRSPSEFAAD